MAAGGARVGCSREVLLAGTRILVGPVAGDSRCMDAWLHQAAREKHDPCLFVSMCRHVIAQLDNVRLAQRNREPDRAGSNIMQGKVSPRLANQVLLAPGAVSA